MGGQEGSTLLCSWWGVLGVSQHIATQWQVFRVFSKLGHCLVVARVLHIFLACCYVVAKVSFLVARALLGWFQGACLQVKRAHPHVSMIFRSLFQG